jgi:hypothetical protein
VAGREKVADVLLCSVWNRDEVLRDGRKASHLEQIRKGQLPRYQLLAECTLDGAKRDLRVVDFGDVRSLPLSLLRRRAVIAGGKRLRLMPPYREHLSQGFARFFMRVGLPVDIAPIK